MPKVTVNHTGACEGVKFVKDNPVIVTDAELKRLRNALGSDVIILEGEVKDVTVKQDKMIKNAPVRKNV